MLIAIIFKNMFQDSLTPPSSPLVQSVEQLEQESYEIMEANQFNAFGEAILL